MGTLGTTLREARGRRTLREIADLSGISIGALSMIERDQRWPSRETLDRLVDALNVRVTFTPRGVALAQERRKR